MRLLLLLLGALAATAAELDMAAMAEKYAPRLRFDSKAGTSEYCFPSSAEDYYNRRLSGDGSRICNQDYTTLMQGEVPTYWHAQVCGYHLHIAYWHFYGYNHQCDIFGGGDRDAWFESVVVKVRDYDMNERLHEVRFGQKDGWYTRIPGRYETVNSDHPIAYVGKATHGYYHDDGGTGSCCYYEDFRDPMEINQYLDSHVNLVPFDNTTAWMNDPRTDVWAGLSAPPFRGDWNLCALNGCAGKNLQVCGTCGCHKSDIGDAPF